jgi:hypothetical protein
MSNENMNFYWNIENNGQIVTEMYIQRSGAPEGESGPYEGVTLRLDRSDRTWNLYRKKKKLASGRGEIPTPLEVGPLVEARRA